MVEFVMPWCISNLRVMLLVGERLWNLKPPKPGNRVSVCDAAISDDG